MTAAESPANADKAWVDGHRQVVERTFAVFLPETEQWPKLSDLRRHFARLGQQVDLDEVVRSQPHFPGELRVVHPEHLDLNIRHLRYVWGGATQLITICLAITRRAVQAYLSEETQPRVTSDDPEIAPLAGTDKRLLIRAGAVMESEQPSPVAGGGSGPDQWSGFPNDPLIMDFKNVVSADDFVARQQKLMEKHAKEMAKHRLPVPTAPVIEVRRQREAPRVFVIMPFGPAWSGTVYAMIRRAAGGVGLSPEPLVHRADEINRPGRITDQIVQAINEAEVIVADISGLNPNVMWELGYAHAMGKPVVLMNQDVHASPFDIRDYRQVIYSSSPTDADEELLARSLRAALETD